MIQFFKGKRNSTTKDKLAPDPFFEDISDWNFTTKKGLKKLVEFTKKNQAALDVAKYLTANEERLLSIAFEESYDEEIEQSIKDNATYNLRLCLRAIAYCSLAQSIEPLNKFVNETLSTLEPHTLNLVIASTICLKNNTSSAQINNDSQLSNDRDENELTEEGLFLLDYLYTKILNLINELARQK